MRLRTMMRSVTIVAAMMMLLILTGCGDDDDSGSAASTTPVSGTPGSDPPSPSPKFGFDPDGTGRPADSSFVFTIEEVGLGVDGYVRLLNFSSVAASTEGLFLCQSPRCLALPDTEIASGQSAVIAASENTGREDVIAVWPDLQLTPSDGELGVYASEDTGDPGAVRGYMQWGSDPHEGTAAATEAGFWVAGYAPTSEDATRLFQSDAGLWLFDE